MRFGKTLIMAVLCLALMPMAVSASPRGPVDLSRVAWKPWPGSPVSTSGCVSTLAPPNSITWIRRHTKGDITGFNSRSMTVYAKQYDCGTYVKYVVVSVRICGNPAGGSWCVVKQRPERVVYVPTPTPTPAPLPPPARLGGVEGQSVRQFAYANTGRTDVAVPSVDRQRIEASLIFGWAKVPTLKAEKARPRPHPVKPVCPPPVPPPPTPPVKPVCEPLPGTPDGLPIDPTLDQVR